MCRSNAPFPVLTHTILTKQLRELEKNCLVHREIIKEIPLRAEYPLTATEVDFVPILGSIMPGERFIRLQPSSNLPLKAG